MSSKYSDAQNIMATQIAYLNAQEGQRAGDLVDSILAKNSENFTKNADGTISIKEGATSGLNEKQLEVAVNIYNLSKESPDGVKGWEDWKIVDVHNDENNSGFYGCVIETGEGEAIIGCRGSESYDMEQTVKDWVIADGGMLLNDCTKQQEEAEKYAKEIWEKYGDKYRYEITGHSLGGLLATHMLITASDEMAEYIDAAINNDGPGANSEDYIQKNWDNIQKRKDKLYHNQWSWVSSLLVQLPLDDDHNRIIKADNDPNHEGILSLLFKHATENVRYDENGNFIPGEKGAFEDDCRKLSDAIENFADYSKTAEGKLVIGTIGLMGMSILTEFVLTSPVICAVVGVIGLVALGYYVGKKVVEKIKEVVKEIKYKYFNKVSGRFEIYPTGINAFIASLKDTSSQLRSQALEIEGIMNGLKYNSPSGNHYRSVLRLNLTSLNSEIKKLQKIYSKAGEALTMYQNTDSNVAELFPKVVV